MAAAQGQGPQYQQHHQQQHLPQHSDDILVQLRRVCRRVVVLLRNLHCLTRMMPGYGLHQSLVFGADATKRGLGNLGGVGGYYLKQHQHQQRPAQQHPLAVPEDLRHHPAAGQIGFALYPSSTDGLRSEAELFGSSNSPFARHEVGSIPTPFGTLHLTGFYDSSLQVNRVMIMRVGRLRSLGLLGVAEDERAQFQQQQAQRGQQVIPQQQPLAHPQRGAIAIPQQNQPHAKVSADDSQHHQSLPSNAMQMAADTAAASSVPFGASPIIQNYAKSPLHRPHTLGRELPPRMMLNRANSLPPGRGLVQNANQGVKIGSGTQTPVSAGSTPRMAGLEGGESKRVMSGLSLALMNEEVKGDDTAPGATAEDQTGDAQFGPTEAEQEDEEENSVRRRALHHPPPAMYGYGYNNPDFQATGHQTLRPSPPDGMNGGSSSAIARSRTSSPSPMVLRAGTPTDYLSSTPPFSQGLAMAAAARAGRSGAPDSPGTPGTAASLRRAGLLRTQQQQQGGGSDRFARPSPAGVGMPDKSPPFVNPMSLRAPPTPDSARAFSSTSQDSSPRKIKSSDFITAAPPAQLHFPDPAAGEKSGSNSLLHPLSSLDMLRTSPFKVSGSSMAVGMGSPAAFASSQQHGSVHNQQISGSENVGFSLLSSLSGTGASPYATPSGSGAFPNPFSPGGPGEEGAGFSSKMGSAYGYASHAGITSSALAPQGPIDNGADGADEMPFAVETGPAPSFGSSGMGSNIADAQRASAGGTPTASGLMAGSTASSQLLVASFAHRCATAGRLTMFDEEEKIPDENAAPIGGSSAVVGSEGTSQPQNAAADDLSSQLADLRAFGASLLADGS